MVRDLRPRGPWVEIPTSSPESCGTPGTLSWKLFLLGSRSSVTGSLQWTPGSFRRSFWVGRRGPLPQVDRGVRPESLRWSPVVTCPTPRITPPVVRVPDLGRPGRVWKVERTPEKSTRSWPWCHCVVWFEKGREGWSRVEDRDPKDCKRDDRSECTHGLELCLSRGFTGGSRNPTRRKKKGR